MAFKQLKGYQEFSAIQIKESWTKCNVGLEHSVSGSYYWLTCQVRFYEGNESDLLVHMGRGSQDDAAGVISILEQAGFTKTRTRYMREWEYHDYERNPSRPGPGKLA
jgi:hypothetical protein